MPVGQKQQRGTARPALLPQRRASVVQRAPIPAAGFADDLRVRYATGAEPANRTGLPSPMLQQAEKMSGLSLQDVRVHYNSAQPAKLGALAFTQGTDIFLGPGQEGHAGHELGHVMQQKRGVVPAEYAINGVRVNADPQLEHNADRWETILSPYSIRDPGQERLTLISEPDMAYLLAAVQCFSLNSFFKSTGWGFLDVAFNLFHAIFRLLNSSKQYSIEIVFSSLGLLSNVMTAIGLSIRSGNDSICSDNDTLKKSNACPAAWISWLCCLIADSLSCLAGGFQMDDDSAEKGGTPFGNAVNNYVAGSSALLAGIAGTCAACSVLFSSEEYPGLKHRAAFDSIAVVFDMVAQCSSLLNNCKACSPLSGIISLVLLGLECILRLVRLALTWSNDEYLRKKEVSSDAGCCASNEDPRPEDDVSAIPSL